MTDPATPGPDGPDAMGRELAGGPEAVAATLAEVERLGARLSPVLGEASGVVLLGTGASLAAARTAAPVWRGRGGRAVLALESAEILFGGRGAIRDGDVVVAISKSGTSPETVGAARLAADAGAAVIAVTAVASSPLADAADVAVGTPIGTEDDASTKSTLAATAALLAMAGALGPGDAAPLRETLDSVVADWATAALLGRSLAAARHVWLLGFGTALGIAAAGALLWHEKVRRPALATTPSDFRHGLIEAVTPGDAVLVLAADAVRAGRDAYVGRLADEIGRVGAPVIAVAAAGENDAVRALTGLLRVQQLARATAHAAGTYRDGFAILRAIVDLTGEDAGISSLG